MQKKKTTTKILRLRLTIQPSLDLNKLADRPFYARENIVSLNRY